ncbi:Na+/H+ antiporter NhaA [Nocardioides aestuarii]|uniref:Na(+)/H(+) antiporter NhaA n=1 Tax=Nocardioides aestuarii TaxID=252231 RepID=A0ABW4TKU7_9ACTN
MHSEPAGGLLLLGATVLALVAANSPLSGTYTALRDLTVGPAALHLDLSLGAWTADGLLALFFFVVGLELKRELVAGDLRDPRRALVPVVAAAGGVVVPVLLFVSVVTLTGGDADALVGWAVPAATDIAFALAVLAVVAPRVPVAVRTFLLTLAVVDDLIAITIIAVGYASGLDGAMLLLGGAGTAAFALAVRRLPSPWLLVALALTTWTLVHASGVHATIAGVALALTVPVFAGPVTDRSDDGLAAAADLGPATRLEHGLKPWSACVAVPLFAFFAAGVAVAGLDGLVSEAASPVAAGIMVALVVGKTVGILGATFLVTRLSGVDLDPQLRWPDLTGVSLLAGIGFTVSLLVGELAYGATGPLGDQAKVGVLLGSVVAAALAALLFGVRSRRR